MIRRLGVVFAVVLTTTALGQVRRSPPNRYGSPTGFGSVLFPGTGTAPKIRLPGSISDPTFAGRLGSTIRGFPPYGGVARRGHRGHSRQVIVPVPIMVGGGYYGYDVPPAGYYQDPMPVTVPMQQQAAPPVVIINQTYRPDRANPVVRTYPDEEEDQQSIRRYDAPVHPMPEPDAPAGEPKSTRATRPVEDDKPTIYLIAFKDQTILPALAYWTEGDTLNYITTQGTPNRASLTLIDTEFSKQLNRERQVEFSLP